jgi:hypothetical protein
MHSEAQIEQDATSPEIQPASDSNEPTKSKRGGKRPGAGRKPNLAKRLLKGVTRDTIIAAVQDIDVGNVIIGLLKSKRELVRLQTLNFIFDRVQGKPKQDLSVSGGMLHVHARDPLLASLPKEGLEKLLRAWDEVFSEYAPTVEDTAQDGPQNQIESKPATQALSVVE